MTARQRIIVGSPAQLDWQAVDQNGEPSDPGVTTVTITRSDGSTITPTGPVTGTGDGPRTVPVPAVDECDTLTLEWVGTLSTGSTVVDVAGGVYFTVAALRAEHRAITSTYPDAEIIAKRRTVEDVIEHARATGLAMVPRFTVLHPSHGVARWRNVRSVRWVETDAGISAVDIDRLVKVTPSGLLTDPSVMRVGVVHGLDSCPTDVRDAAMLYVRHKLTAGQSQVDFRPVASVNPDGSRDQFATPGLSIWVSGIPEVDEVIKRWRPPAMPRSIAVGSWLG